MQIKGINTQNLNKNKVKLLEKNIFPLRFNENSVRIFLNEYLKINICFVWHEIKKLGKQILI